MRDFIIIVEKLVISVIYSTKINNRAHNSAIQPPLILYYLAWLLIFVYLNFFVLYGNFLNY